MTPEEIQDFESKCELLQTLLESTVNLSISMRLDGIAGIIMAIQTCSVDRSMPQLCKHIAGFMEDKLATLTPSSEESH